jgi:hypothetical protein
MFATAAEALAQFYAETFATYDYRIVNVWDNGEFLTGATVELYERGVLVGTEEFVGSTEEDCGMTSAYGNANLAVTQAISFAASWVEAEERRAEAARLGVHPLEIEFAPFGPAWQAEREAREREVAYA